MKFIFTSEDFSYNLIKYVRGGLLAKYHTVVRLVETTKPLYRLLPRSMRARLPLIAVTDWRELPLDADAWFYGLSYGKRSRPLDPAHADLLRNYRGALVFYQNDDGLDFFLHKIPGDLVEKAALFLRNHWPADGSKIPAVIKDRTGFINPYLHRLKPEAGEELRQRPIEIAFYGLNTGGCSGQLYREKAVRLLRSAGGGLTGGLIQSDEYPAPGELCVGRLSPREHLRTISRSKICLALWGNCPLTFRFFEGLSRRCLVLAQDLSGLRFASCGLTPGVHYVPIMSDLSDLIAKTSYYSSHGKDAQAIADAGFAHFKNYYAFRGVRYPAALFDEITASWKGLLKPVARPSLSSGILANLLQHINSI